MFMHLTLGSPLKVSNLQRVQGLLDVLKMMRGAWCSLEKKGEKNNLYLCNTFKKGQGRC